MQAPDDRPRAVLRFGLFELAPDTGELRKAGRPVRLQPQPARVLAVLAGRAGELVTREELHREVWGEGTHVDLDQGINFSIRQIRAALGDSAEAPVYVETVPRRGYRFLAPVEASSPTPGGPPPSPPPVAARWRLPHSAVAAVLLLLLALALFAAARAGRPPSKLREDRAMLAVLPFEDLSGVPGQEHWSNGLTEELISQLGRMDPGRLGVIARTSSMRYKGAREPVDRIGRELGVDYVLEGSVRRSGERWRITAQLIEVGDQTHLWAESYDREAADVLAVQQEVSEKVARALALELLPGSPATAPAVPPAAREAFLKGRYLLQKRDRTTADTEKSVALFETAVAAAPSYAAAWAGLADALNALPRPPREIVPRARAAALRALEIDPGLAPAHHRLAGIHLYYDWDWEAARREYERAIELDPGYATAYHSFAAWFSILGRHDEALARMERARELDPVSVSVNGDVGWYFYFARRFPEAIEQCRKTLELEPGHAGARSCLLSSHLLSGDHPAARVRARELMVLQNAPPEALAALDRGTGMDAYWRWTLERLSAQAAREHVSPVHFALAHLSLGDREAAFRELERAWRERSGWLLPFLAVEPRLDPLRRDPRYAALLRRMRLPPGTPR